jgi:lipopolysaccharide transport protein LptA
MLRTRLISAGKLATLVIFVSLVVSLGVYLVKHNRGTLIGQAGAKLQGRVVAILNNSRYSHEVQGQVRFVLTAATDKSYEDGTHELESVRLESHGTNGTRNDVVTSDRASVSDISDLGHLDAEFISNVDLETSDGLSLKTNYMKFSQTLNTVETPEVVTFERKNLAGKCTGMLIEASVERVHMLKDVDVTLKPEGSAESPKAGKSKGATLAGKPKDPVRITGDSAVLEKQEHQIKFTGYVVVTKVSDEMRADQMTGYLDGANHVERIEARSNSYLKQSGKAEIKSNDMDFFFAGGQRLEKALASGGVYAKSLGPQPIREAWSDTCEATFIEGAQGNNNVDALKLETNARVKVHAPAATGARNPAERDFTANTINLKFFPDGGGMRTADGAGSTVMTITPVRAEGGAEKKTLKAPHMLATFFEGENQIKTFNADGGVRVDLESMVAGGHPPRTTTSERLTATFSAESQDIDRVTQEGNFKFNEGDRNGEAQRAIYDAGIELLSLRGQRPVGWDTKARTQADEIDYDQKNDETHARGNVRTTYINRDTPGGAMPFRPGDKGGEKKKKTPIYITSERADARNEDGIAIYTGDARGWQDDNFVKADRLELYKSDNHMVAIGHVDSALYTVEREISPGKREVVPAFATSDRMTYSDAERKVHYEGKVKARQGTDRIDAADLNVYLKSEVNEVDHKVAEGQVELVQPGRHGFGDKLTYTTEDGRAVLVGKSAKVQDEESGSTMGSRLTFYNRDDKILVDNQHGTGRVRSTHRLNKSKENR